MEEHAHRTTIRASESTVALAQSIADRYGITVAELIEMLLVTFAERAEEPPTPTVAREPARVIDLAERRGQRERFGASRAPRRTTASRLICADDDRE